MIKGLAVSIFDRFRAFNELHQDGISEKKLLSFLFFLTIRTTLSLVSFSLGR